MRPPLAPKDEATVSRILKVNHAGEYGAIRIYAGQRLIARHTQPDLLPFLDEVYSHEVEHCRKFLAAMPERGSRPCRMMWAWGLGGYALGIGTALLGRTAILVCTAAVESTVHAHLADQIRYLDGRDGELKQLIADIQVQELEHLGYAEARLGNWAAYRPLDRFIRLATEAVIWLSTQGDVARMQRALQT